MPADVSIEETVEITRTCARTCTWDKSEGLLDTVQFVTFILHRARPPSLQTLAYPTSLRSLLRGETSISPLTSSTLGLNSALTLALALVFILHFSLIPLNSHSLERLALNRLLQHQRIDQSNQLVRINPFVVEEADFEGCEPFATVSNDD